MPPHIGADFRRISLPTGRERPIMVANLATRDDGFRVAQQHESAHDTPLRDVHRIVSAAAQNATVLRHFREAGRARRFSGLSGLDLTK
jgi:hypothetical protein